MAALAKDTAIPVPLSRWDVSRADLVSGVRPGQFASLLENVEGFDTTAFGVTHAGSGWLVVCVLGGGVMTLGNHN